MSSQYYNMPYVDKFRAQLNQINQKIANDQKKAAEEAKKNGGTAPQQQTGRYTRAHAKWDLRHERNRAKYGNGSSSSDRLYQREIYREMRRQNQLLEEINRKLGGKQLNTEG